MSASGPKLFDDDLACDVRELFAELLRRGKTCPQATAVLVRDFDEVFGTQEETVFWLALAAVQWEHGMLQQRLLKRVLRIIKTGADLERWSDDPPLLRQRRRALASLAERLKTPKRRPKPVHRRQRPPLHFPWERGEVLAYQLPSGHSLLFRVVGVERNWQAELPTCELLDWSGKEVPETKVIRQLPIRRNKRYPSESTFHFPMLKKHLSRCRSLNLRLPPTMPENEWKIPLNFDALPAELKEYFGMTVE